MSASNYHQDFSWSQFSPIDSSGTQRSIFKSAYKNLRFVLELQEIRTLSDADASNLPGLSYEYYGVTDYWRVLLGYNGLVDPIQDVYAGQRFNIPTKNSITRWLTQQQDNQQRVIMI